MFWKNPQQRAEDIARKTFDQLGRDGKVRTANDLLKLSQYQRIAHLSGFHGVPWSQLPEDFSRMIESALQEILDLEYGVGVLQAHVTIEYSESFYVDAVFGTSSSTVKSSWYVTRL